MFTPNHNFRREYERIFKIDPAAANVMLLLCELADEKGQVMLGPCPEREIQQLMITRFDDPRAHQLPRGPKR